MINYKIDGINEFAQKNIDVDNLLNCAKKIFEYYLADLDIYDNSCLANYEYNTISCDFLFTTGVKTHEINKNYRNKNYPADIITFAVFADSMEDERFILDLEINLGEVIIALDKIETSANEKQTTFENELLFIISHGIMHLLGFDHQSEEEFNFVVEKQKKALESIGIKYVKI